MIEGNNKFERKSFEGNGNRIQLTQSIVKIYSKKLHCYRNTDQTRLGITEDTTKVLHVKKSKFVLQCVYIYYLSDKITEVESTRENWIGTAPHSWNVYDRLVKDVKSPTSTIGTHISPPYFK